MLLVDLDESVKTTCFHCGEKSDGAVQSGGKVFCCLGCQTVYELLRSKDLCGYYDFSQRTTPTFKQTSQSRFDFVDDAELRQTLLQFSDGVIAKTSFRLPQIHCASCIWLLENLFKINPAILRSEVDFLKKEIVLTFREKEIKLSEIVSLLTRLGYEPELRLASNVASNPALTNSQRRLYLQVGLAGFVFGNVMIFSFPDYLDSTGILSAQFRNLFGWLSIVLATPVLLFSASDYFISSWYALKQRKISLDVPVALGMSALYFRSVYDIVSGTGTGYLDSFTGLVFFLLIGKIFQQKTFAALSFDQEYAAYFPLSVALHQNGTETYIPIAKLKIGDDIFLRNRELVPADSILHSPYASCDYSFVTGESEPVTIKFGDLVYAGGRIIGTGAKLVVTKEVSHSYLTQLWNNEAFHKEKHSSLLEISDAFGKYFTLVVSLIALVAAWYWLPDTGKAINVFTAVLIIACPCALTLAAPFTLGAAVAIFGKAKFYLKNIGVVTDLASLDTIVFDKTGTLTETGKAEVYFEGTPLTEREKALITSGLQPSTHPLSRQIIAKLRVESDQKQNIFSSINNFVEIAGAGSEANINGHIIAIGSADWIRQRTGKVILTQPNATTAHLEIDQQFRGSFHLKNVYRNGLQELFNTLQTDYELHLLSGDNDRERENLSKLFPDHHLAFFQSPEDKLNVVKSLQQNKTSVAMIGDGLNDAGALRQSNVGIALTEDTSNFTPACDAILAAENLQRLPVFIGFARYAMRVLIACFLISLAYNTIGLSLAVTGKLSPLVTAIFMPLSSLSVVAIAWGAMKICERKIAG